MKETFYILFVGLTGTVAVSIGLPHINLIHTRILNHDERNKRQNVEIEVAAEYGSNWDIRNVRLEIFAKIEFFV